MDQDESRTLYRRQLPEIYLLLVWRAARPESGVAGAREEFIICRFITTDTLRIAAGTAAKTAARVAFFLAVTALSVRLLHRISTRAIPASHRPSDHDSYCIRHYTGGATPESTDFIANDRGATTRARVQ